MNFIPPACFLDNAPPVKYIPKDDRSSEPINTPKLRRKKSLVSLWNRRSPAEEPPPVPEIPEAFVSPSYSADGSTYSFSVNETVSLHASIHTPAIREGLIVSGVSYMDLSESDSESEASQRPALLHRLRRKLSKTDLTALNEQAPPVPSNSPSVTSLIPSSPGADSPGFRARARRSTNAKDPAALRISSYTNSSSAEVTSLRSLSSLTSSRSPRTPRDLNSKLLDNPPLDPDFKFNEFMTSNKSKSGPSPRTEAMGLSSRPGKSAPPVKMARSRKYETVSVQATRESIHGYASYLSQAKTHGLPMPDMIDEDEGEWNRAVDWVRGQEAERVTREMKAAKIENDGRRSEEIRQAQKELEWQSKVGLAKQFIRRTSTAWVPKRNSHELPTDEAARNTIAEALHLANKHGNLDPGFTELRKRFFAQFSRSHDGEIPRSAPLPYRSGWSDTAADGFSPRPPDPVQQFTRGSTARVYQQTFPTRSVSPVGSSRFESQGSPSLHLDAITKEHAYENAYDGLGIQMEPPDPEKRNVALDGRGPFVLPVPVPASPVESLRSQRNAFSPGEASSSASPQESSQNLSSSNSVDPASSTSVIDGTDSREHLQFSAPDTLANARVFKVDRDSKILDRFVVKRTPKLYQTIDAARELAEARMGITSSPLPSPPSPRKDSVFDTPLKSTKKMHSAPVEGNMFKRAAKHPTLRAMVSSMSMRSPDATEMVLSPPTPNSNHPALRKAQGNPVTPTAAGHRFMAQKDNGTNLAPRASTSTASDEPIMTPLSATVSDCSSQKSSNAAATGGDRWAQRVRQRANVERNWKENGILGAPVKQSPIPETTVALSPVQVSQSGLPHLPQQALLETPTSPTSLPSNPPATLISTAAVRQKFSPHLSRKTQDSPTPLNIKKLNQSPKMQLGLSLPGSPAPLQVPKLRGHPAAKRVQEGNSRNASKARVLSHPFDSDSDPFAKGGGIIKGDEGWPLSDTSTGNAAIKYQQPYERSPLEGDIDKVVKEWRHASAKQGPPTSKSCLTKDTDIAGKYQYVRNHLELDLLRTPAAGKAHPNHPFHWESTNVMCKGVHDDARTSSDTSATGTGDESFRVCTFCEETCCYFGQQIGRANIQTKGRDQTLEELKNKARSHVYFLRGLCPEGIEDYQVLMECGLCVRVCCPACANICQYPMCTQPVCKDCVENEDGICGDH